MSRYLHCFVAHFGSAFTGTSQDPGVQVNHESEEEEIFVEGERKKNEEGGRRD